MKGGSTVAKRMGRPGRQLVVVVLTLCVIVFGSAIGTGTVKAMEEALVPWHGLSTMMGPMATNPALLQALDGITVRVETIRPASTSLPGAMLYMYQEADTGIGAGQLGYVSVKDGSTKLSRLMYSGAKPLGAFGAFGFGVTHTRVQPEVAADGWSTWGLDVGLSGRLFKRVDIGAVVRNALLHGDPPGAEAMPPSLHTGLALDLGPFTVAGDYLLRGREAPFVHGYAYGLEGRLGRLSARFGGRLFPESSFRYTHYGLGYGLDIGRIDVSVGEFAQGSPGGDTTQQTLVFGVSLHF